MQNRYKALLDNQLSAEQFSRQALGLLEAELREVTLFSLQEWLKLDIVSPDLFNAVANLRFPSWGSWNGLIITLRKVRNKALQQADAATREKIEKSPLTDLLNRLFSNIKNENNAPLLKAFYQLSKQSLPRKPSLQSLLSTPIGLRNRISHDNPTDEQFWNDLSQSLRPVIEWLAEEDSNNHQQLDRSPPWFIQKDEQWFTYNGISAKGDAINYVSDTGTALESSEHIHDVLLTLQKIMGKKDLQETDFRKLLSKLAPEESKGVLVGDYLVGKFISEGAHGAVHQGIQLSTGRSVAIKFLKEGLSPDIALRFKQEAEFLSHLNHPHIVDVIGYVENQAWSPPRARDYSLSDEKWYQDFSNGSTSGGIKTFIAMEWITGQTLDDYFIEKQAQASTGSVHRNTADFPKLTQWFIDITTALEHVHQSDIIHRDVKPGNLMVNEQGIIKLMDFGIARSYEGLDARLTTDLNARLGSPAYMSPEQIKANEANDRVGPASDVYGLMAVFYELYTQKRLYNHDDKTVTIETITELKTDKDKKERPTAPVEHNKKIPQEINTILSIGLEHEIADRYPDMETLRTDLVHVMRDEPIEYKKPTMLRRAQLGYRRNRGVINVVLMSLLIISSVFGWDYYRVTIERDKAEVARVEAEQSAVAERKAKELAIVAEQDAKKERDRAVKAEHAKQQQVLETNYQLAKSYEQKAMRSLEKGENDQEESGKQSIKEYKKAWLYALEAENLQLPKDKIALKEKSLVKLTTISAKAVSPEKKATATFFNQAFLMFIADVAYNPNGLNLASVSGEIVSIWSLKTGKLIQTLKGHTGNIYSLAYSPDGTVLATASADKTIHLWDVKTGDLKQTLSGHTDKVKLVAFSKDSLTIASASEDKSIRLWETKTGILKKILAGHTDRITSIAFSPKDNNLLASGSDDRTVKLWDIGTGSLKKELSYAYKTNTIAFSPDGSILAIGSSNITKDIKLDPSDFPDKNALIKTATERLMAQRRSGCRKT